MIRPQRRELFWAERTIDAKAGRLIIYPESLFLGGEITETCIKKSQPWMNGV